MNKTIEFTEQAMDTIRNMGNEVRRLQYELGEDNKHFIAAASSLSLSLIQMMNLGGKVMSDGEFSLICQNDYLTYGVNYTGTSYNEYDAGTWSVNS
jgi:hypothetical protein